MDTSSPLLSVGDLNRAIAESLTERFDAVLVSGEISNFKAYDSGHWYFSLKDEEGQIRCVMFRGKNAQLGFMPQSGDQVEVAASVSMYVPRGDVQLTIHSLRKAGLGGLYEAFLKLKEKLAKAGLFDENRKRPIPSHPKSLAIITSAQAAALKDVLTTLARRAPHIPIFIYPTLVQGPDAPAGIIHALKQANQDKLGEVILLVRGGGSIEDLWAFNDEALANAIASSSIPVISGVGHETDFTIADFCADLRAPTPTAAAELCALDQASELAALAYCVESMAQSMSVALEQAGQRLDRAERQLGRPSGWLHTQQSDCSALANRMGRAIQQQVNRRKLALQPMALRLQRAASDMPAMQSRRLDKAQWLLQTLDPALVLQRGYAWLHNAEGKALSSVKEMHMGQPVTAQLVDGEVLLRVEGLP